MLLGRTGFEWTLAWPIWWAAITVSFFRQLQVVIVCLRVDHMLFLRVGHMMLPGGCSCSTCQSILAYFSVEFTLFSALLTADSHRLLFPNLPYVYFYQPHPASLLIVEIYFLLSRDRFRTHFDTLKLWIKKETVKYCVVSFLMVGIFMLSVTNVKLGWFLSYDLCYNVIKLYFVCQIYLKSC